MDMVQLNNVAYRYPGKKEAALAGISLRIRRGELVAVAGPNGSGKSTLCRVLTGFAPHFFRGTLTGKAVIDGRDTTRTPLAELTATAGFVFQNPYAQLSGARFTVREELAFGLENLGLDPDVISERIEKIMHRIDISHLREREPMTLSGGQAQRVALASILVMEPDLLVLDEPTAELDPRAGEQILDLAAGMAENGTTVVLATQSLDWATRRADRLIVLHDGKILHNGSPRDLIENGLSPNPGVRLPTWTSIAERARGKNLWPAHRPLPVTFEETVQGFSSKPASHP